jgi:hypothetical protein
MEYFLSEKVIKECNRHYIWNDINNKKGYISVYCKNNFKKYHFKIIKQCNKKYGWIVERTRIPKWLKNVIKPSF